MVKLTAILLLKFMGPDKDPYLLGNAADLSTFGFFQRSSVREMLVFVSRTVVRKTAIGTRQTVQHEDYQVHVYNKDGLAAVVFTDKDYPVRAGFCVASQAIDDFAAQQGDAWRGATQDVDTGNEALEASLVKFQVS